MIFSRFELNGRKALVTGSSRGIGRSLALALAEAGADVVLHGIRRSPAAEETLSAVESRGRKAFWVEGDLAAEGGRPVAERTLAATGGVDILVLNASIQNRREWLEIPPVEAEAQWRANFQASLELAQALVPFMQRQKWGRVLTIGSVQQARPHPQMLVYAATKAAQMSLVLSLAKQLAPDGITVNNLAPGVILTDRNTDALADPDYAERVRQSIPAGYFGESADCAGAALLLCSEAGRYVTGQNLYVDGGIGLP